MFEYKFPMAGITADVVLLSKHEGEIYFMGIIRGGDPFKGSIAFPGGFVNVLTETVLEAAIRELKEETGIDIKYLDFVGFYDDVNRDPRSRVITFAYTAQVGYELIDYAIAADDAVEVSWYKVSDALEGRITLAFDHLKILRDSFLMSDLA